MCKLSKFLAPIIMKTVYNLSNTPRSDMAYMDNTRSIVASNFKIQILKTVKRGLECAPTFWKRLLEQRGSCQRTLLIWRLKNFDGAARTHSNAKNIARDTFVYGKHKFPFLFFKHYKDYIQPFRRINSANLLATLGSMFGRFCYWTGDI
jgi:hypothetical protein